MSGLSALSSSCTALTSASARSHRMALSEHDSDVISALEQRWRRSCSSRRASSSSPHRISSCRAILPAESSNALAAFREPSSSTCWNDDVSLISFSLPRRCIWSLLISSFSASFRARAASSSDRTARSCSTSRSRASSNEREDAASACALRSWSTSPLIAATFASKALLVAAVSAIAFFIPAVRSTLSWI